jgi:parallel beta-helix repeat protein
MILNNIISNNTAGNGGGIYNKLSPALISNNIITTNAALYAGGGISYYEIISGWEPSPSIMSNNIISYNIVSSESAIALGGGILLDGLALTSSVTITNNIIICNSAIGRDNSYGGGIYLWRSHPFTSLNITYCNLWGNYPNNYSNCLPDEGCIAVDPLFIENSQWNDYYYLKRDSPCIDAGNASLIYNDKEDPLNPGNALLPSQGTIRNDMGCYGGPTPLILKWDNYPPIADAGHDLTAWVGETVFFNGSGCYDLDGTIVSYEWTFGDGNISQLQNPTNTYTTAGTYTVMLTITDDEGASDNDTAIVTVHAVIANANGPYMGYVDEEIQFIGSASGVFPPYNWSWGFGDGNISYLQNPTHNYSLADIYTITLTVTDDEGNNDTNTTFAAVGEYPVTAEAHGPYFGYVNEPIEFMGSASDGFSPYVWLWDFGDEVGESEQQNPSYTYTTEGEYIATLTVTDSMGFDDNDTAVVNITIRPSYVWVNQSFNENTPGWLYDHFDTISEGIATVALGGTVNVSNGIYYEHDIVIDKSIDLIGEDRGNTIIDGSGVGTVLSVSADLVNISGFTIQHSANYDVGIWIEGVGNMIYGNRFKENYFGIYLSGYSRVCSDNMIFENLIANNDYGIQLDYASNNLIYHNNFVDNNQHASNNEVNMWDNGYPAGGNYWDDHPDPHDDYSGENQDIPMPEGDGIIDLGLPVGGLNPYIIPGGGQDTYPLYTPLSDETAPVILDVEANPLVQLLDGSVNITCTVTDNIEVDVVNVNITGPPGFTPVNVSMNHILSTSNYYYESSYNVGGTYDFYVWAVDSSGNTALSETKYFEIVLIDSIVITESSGGSEIPDRTIGTGCNVAGYASAYNDTFGYITLVSVDWSVETVDSDASTAPSTGESSTFYSGTINNTNVIWKADDGNGHSDTVAFVIENLPVYVDDDADPEWYGDTNVSTINEALEIVGIGQTVYVYEGIYYEIIVIDKPLSLMGMSQTSTIINSSAGGPVITISANWVNVSGFTIQQSSYDCAGITVSSDNNTIIGNNIENNYYGIYLSESSNNTIAENTINSPNNYGWGIVLEMFCSHNTLLENMINHNFVGIGLISVSNNIITKNNVTAGQYGIALVQSSYNTISENHIIDTEDWGIYLISLSEDNTIYHNSFNSTYSGQNAYDECSNYWYNASLSQGNYWSDYLERYPDAVDADSDGCWDTPYDILGKDPPNQDLYPLVNPY